VELVNDVPLAIREIGKDLTEITAQPHVRLSIRKGEQERSRYIWLTLGKVSYVDLNGDGMFDSMKDDRASQTRYYIRVDNLFVEIDSPNKQGLLSKMARSIGGRALFEFVGGRWTMKAVYPPPPEPSKPDPDDLFAPLTPPPPLPKRLEGPIGPSEPIKWHVEDRDVELKGEP
jgi:hypothetical protein